MITDQLKYFAVKDRYLHLYHFRKEMVPQIIPLTKLK